MPTNFASNATAPRMRSASASIVRSASGRATKVVSLGLVKPGLQNQLCGDRVARGLAAPSANTGAGKLRIGGKGREPFVDTRHVQSEAARELACEAFGARRHLVLAAVSMQRAADDH